MDLDITFESESQFISFEDIGELIIEYTETDDSFDITFDDDGTGLFTVNLEKAEAFSVDFTQDNTSTFNVEFNPEAFNISFAPDDAVDVTLVGDDQFDIVLSQFGEPGESAYQIAVRLGFVGTEQEWLDAIDNGNVDLTIFYTKLESNARYATAAQGVKADSALQTIPEGYKTETYNDTRYIQESDRPDFATAAQGTKADSALQGFTELNVVQQGDSTYVDKIRTDLDELELEVPSEYLTETEGDARYIQESERPDFATAAQGTKADSALQSIPTEYLTQTEGDSRYITEAEATTDFATKAQGAKADTALQSIPSEYVTETEGDVRYIQESERTDFATAAQGVKAASALQSIPGTYKTQTQNDERYIKESDRDEFATANQGAKADKALPTLGAAGALTVPDDIDIQSGKVVLKRGDEIISTATLPVAPASTNNFMPDNYYDKTEVNALLEESGTSWIDYVGGIPGDSTFLENGDEIIPYNSGVYFRLITSADVDSFYTKRTGNVLTELLVTRGG